ncbi:MAG TPA: cobalamin-dependent protein [Spirochaetota bacterium]|nr:cobalamin-dependent protein [Spirochaetota bacterium]
MKNLYSVLIKQLQLGQADKITIHIEQALQEGVHYTDILNHGLIKGMKLIGDKFSKNEIFVPEVLLSARAMNRALAVLEPVMRQAEQKKKKTVVLGTVKGDLHDIGKNLVAVILRGYGYKVVDVGVDVTARRFTETAVQYNADVVGISALLTTTMPYINKIITALEQSGCRAVTIAGGAPLTRQRALELGADTFAVNAGDAPLAVSKVLQARKNKSK